jgi:hypothetical protein
MMGQRIFIPGYLLVIVGLFFTACSTEDEPTPAEPILVNTAATSSLTTTLSPLPTTTQPTPTTISSSNTDLSLPTATSFLSQTPRPTLPPEPTNTPRPEPAYLATEAALPLTDQYDIPGWVSDPEAVVGLTMAFNDEYDRDSIIIINIVTGEVIYLPVIFGGSAYWTEENGELFITFRSDLRSSPDPWNGYIEQIDLVTGRVTCTLRPNPLPTNPPPEPLPPYLLHQYESQLGHIVTFTDYDDGTNLIQLENSDGTSFELTDPLGNDNASEIAVAWSSNGELVGVSRAESLENFDIVGHLTIYNSRGKVVQIFEGATHEVGWTTAPGSMVLYEDYYNGRRLCLADIENNTLDCDRLTAWNEAWATATRGYNWVGNGEAILFDFLGLDEPRVGVCLLTISSNEIDCLLEQEFEAGPAAATHTVGPDGNKAAFHLLNNDTLLATCFYNLETNQYVQECPLLWQGNPVANKTIFWSQLADYAYFFRYGMTTIGESGNQEACLVFWSTAEFTCPLSADILDSYFIVSTNLSPDEKFWAVYYQPYSPEGHNAGFRTLGILNVQTGQFQSYGYSSKDFLWRPPLE